MLAKLLKRTRNFRSTATIDTLWYVGFSDTKGPLRWWHWFTRPKFRHVYMWTEINKDQWLFMNMTKGGLVMTTFHHTGPEKDRNNFLRKEYNIYAIAAAHGMVATSIPIRRLAPFTCVELARSLLGIDKMLYTPWQLYKFIISNRLANV